MVGCESRGKSWLDCTPDIEGLEILGRDIAWKMERVDVGLSASTIKIESIRDVAEGEPPTFIKALKQWWHVAKLWLVGGWMMRALH